MNTTAAAANQSTPSNKQQNQTAKEVIAANIQSLIEQLEQGALGGPHRLSHRDGQVSQLQLWQHSGDCTAKTGRDPRCWSLRLESAWPQSQEGRAWHPHSRSRDQDSPEEGRRSRKGRPHSESCRLGRIPCRLCLRCIARPKARNFPSSPGASPATPDKYRDRLVDFVIAQGIALDSKRPSPLALGMSYGGKIALLPGQSSAEEFSTLVHELAHEMLHKGRTPH